MEALGMRLLYIFVFAILLPKAILRAQTQPISPAALPYAICATPELMANAAQRGARIPELTAVGLLCQGRTPRQRTLVSAQQHFLIHYDVTGTDAVPTTDKDGNGIPDYIDSMAIEL